jgi:hypothetical protein
MKRKEKESFEAYKQRRAKDKILQETLIKGVFHSKTSSPPVYATAQFYKMKFQRMLRKFKGGGIPA